MASKPKTPNQYANLSTELALLEAIRMALVNEQPLQIAATLPLPFSATLSQVYITLFQRGLKPLRWGARKATLQKTLQRIIERLQSNPALANFEIGNHAQCRLMFEIVTEEQPCNIQALTGQALTEYRFEPGITGLKYSYKDVLRYFMPTDAVIHSIMSVTQLLNFLAKKTGIATQTDSINERVQLMRDAPIEFSLISSLAFISFQQQVIPLYRGYPDQVNFSQAIIRSSILNSIDWLVANMRPDGRFLYYYDPYLDTEVDFEHPKMLNPLYNNILRHSGGTVTLIRGYELTQDPQYLIAAKRSLDFLVSTFREHQVEQHYACYPFFNKKSKLGGAGLGLVALMHYYRHTQDESYRKQMDGLVRHILSRVAADGEMIGYYIHPGFNQGEPLIDPPDAIKRQLFSFYYPGETLLGLALYDQHISSIDPDLSAEIRQKSIMALDFLVTQRPLKYQELFLSLPADAWLMQAIEEWAKVEGFQQQAYYDFVFNDAQTLLKQMYTEANAPYPDYVGGFYYQYGDHVYHDASRCEGLVAAYYLAKHLGDQQQAALILQGMLKAAKGLLRTRHTPESTYAHRYPEKSLHSFRFKLTRQWVRVDSVQHAACFYARLLPLLNDQTEKEFTNLPPPPQTGFQLLKQLSKSGFSDVYQACDLANSQRFYAIKLLNHTRFVHFIQTEIAILQTLNAYPHAVKFHGTGTIHNRIYLKFDFIDGDNLRNIVRQQGPLDEQSALQILQDIRAFLTFSQQQGILHLDIKPENILYHQGKYTLIDWGLAQQATVVRTLARKGDPIYLAPEMYRGYRDFASEIYALGCVLYYVLTGQHIYDLQTADTLAAKMAAHIYLQPEYPTHLSPKWQSLLHGMLDKNPQTRMSFNQIEPLLSAIHNTTFNAPAQPLTTLNFKDEISLLQRLAEDGVAYAQTALGDYYQQGDPLPQDDLLAADWFEQAAQQGFARGLTRLGLAYLQGRGRAFDFVKALHYFRQAADQGHAAAHYYLGLAYENGLGVNIDLVHAVSSYTQAAQNGNRNAYKALARLNVAAPVPLL